MAKKTFRQLIKPVAKLATKIRNKAYTKAYSVGKRNKVIKKFSLNHKNLTINKKSLLGQ